MTTPTARATAFILPKVFADTGRDITSLAPGAVPLDVQVLTSLLLNPAAQCFKMSRREADKVRRQLAWFREQEEFAPLVADALKRVHPRLY